MPDLVIKMWEQIQGFIVHWGLNILKAVFVILLLRYAYVFAKILVLRRIYEGLSEHVRLIVDKAIRYALVVVGVLWILGIFGVNPTGLVAGLGLLSVAIGFAAQTSVSNLISGFFLIFERPFSVGDAVDIGGNTGIVLSIGLLSTKMRTYDNILVRIPNETVLKATIKTYTAFDIRRIDTTVGIAYAEDIEEARKVILEFLNSEPVFLAEPPPIVFAEELADSSVNLKVLVWIRRVDYIKAKETLVKGIKNALDKAGIEIPFPQRVIYIKQEDNKD